MYKFIYTLNIVIDHRIFLTLAILLTTIVIITFVTFCHCISSLFLLLVVMIFYLDSCPSLSRISTYIFI